MGVSMKKIDDPELVLLQKIKELKNSIGESKEIDELIVLAEIVVRERFQHALSYMMKAMQQVDMKEELDVIIKKMGEELARKK